MCVPLCVCTIMYDVCVYTYDVHNILCLSDVRACENVHIIFLLSPAKSLQRRPPRYSSLALHTICWPRRLCVCVCVCVCLCVCARARACACVRERERGRKREKERKRERKESKRGRKRGRERARERLKTHNIVGCSLRIQSR